MSKLYSHTHTLGFHVFSKPNITDDNYTESLKSEILKNAKCPPGRW